jgi:hypothetical protein
MAEAAPAPSRNRGEEATHHVDSQVNPARVKGIGEIGISGAASAVTNAVERPSRTPPPNFRSELVILRHETPKMFCYNPPGLFIRRNFYMQLRTCAWHDDVDLRRNDTAEDGDAEGDEESDDEQDDDDFDDDDFDDDDLDEDLDDDDLDDLDDDDLDDDDEEEASEDDEDDDK